MDSPRFDGNDDVYNYSNDIDHLSSMNTTSVNAGVSGTSTASRLPTANQMTEDQRCIFEFPGLKYPVRHTQKNTQKFVSRPDLASMSSSSSSPDCSHSRNCSRTSDGVAGNSINRTQQKRTTYYKMHSQSFSTWEISQSIQPPSVIETSQVVVHRSELCKTINNYLVLGLLGRGAFGKVKLIESITTGEKLAMKILPVPKTKASEKHRIAIRREIAVMKRLKHPNMVRLYEVLGNMESGKLYLVIQYISGGSIAKKVSPTMIQPIKEETLKYQARQLVNVLKYLQINGVVHRDIKPDNILVDENGNAFLSDFGVSAVCTDEVVSGVEGTPAFMAPEVCRGDIEVTGHLVDIWALGVSLFQLIYGVLPFVAANVMDLTRQIVGDPLIFPDDDPTRWLPFVDEFGLPEVVASAEFKEVIRGMLAKDSTERWDVRRILNSDWFAGMEKQTLNDVFLQAVDDTPINLDGPLEDLSDVIIPAEIMYI